uniref:Translation initiation factor IF-2, chloroplastic n=1 Tax=Caloglossa monosticha TaxID=76906 RepID=A0A1Z1M4Q4_9FLOR|nr:translation initiation factor 2 [Caloglossa monosticha]ARW61047.1 translation initiation factor 2 [Caloglossa monosticha]
MSNTVYSSEILYLKLPKLINSYSKVNSDTPNSTSQVKSLKDFSNVNNSKKHNINQSNKFEKKYKNNINSEDSLEFKKNKSKLNKKTRKNPILDTEDLFIDESNNLYNKNINSYRLSKYKKKDKIKNLSNISTSYDDDKNMIVNSQVFLSSPLSIQDLSIKLNIPEAEIITYLFLKGVSVTINDIIDISTAKEVALNYNFRIIENDCDHNKVEEKIYNLNNNDVKTRRSPVITVFGHVDHGKTTLLDTIMKTNFVKMEHGGITQSINGYEIEWLYESENYKLVFLDTPGHEAFTSMRFRGAKVTDIALLVVAADDGLKPQTIESIKYILSMNLAYIVVINKIDKTDVDIVKIKKELSLYDIVAEEWGGNAVIVEVSALTGQNIDVLLSSICLIAELNNFTADIDKPAQGTILEAYLDKKQGILSNALVQQGTLKLGDFIVAGKVYGKVKSLLNIVNEKIDNVYPSSIVQILGFSSPPESGAKFSVVINEKEAKQLIDSSNNTDFNKSNIFKSLNKKVSFDNGNNVKQLNLVLKTDTQGTLEALVNSLVKISQEKVQINLINASIGNVSSTDIELALSANALIIGFRINSSVYTDNLIKQYKLNFITFNIIYDLLNYVNKCMLNLVDLEYENIFLGEAVVQTVFSINKKAVAGCLVRKGKLKKMSYIYIYENNSLFYEGVLVSLKRLKDDVNEVLFGNECGIMCGYDNWKAGNIIKAYDLVPKEKTL